ncbi:MAG: hypothetical protein KKB53_09310, partial [Acidobacteria bacterium]|nr:hypothetical protein [Acidobacteriota bacterium]
TTAWIDSQLIFIYAKRGKREKAEKLLQELEDQSKQTYIPMSGYRMAFHTGLGEIDESIQWYNKAYEERILTVPYWRFESGLGIVRDHPRYQAVMNELGLDDWKHRPRLDLK